MDASTHVVEVPSRDSTSWSAPCRGEHVVEGCRGLHMSCRRRHIACRGGVLSWATYTPRHGVSMSWGNPLVIIAPTTYLHCLHDMGDVVEVRREHILVYR